MKIINYIPVLLALLLLPLFSNAQYIVDYKNKGDLFFKQKDYYAAAVYYQKALKILPETTKYLPYNVYTTGEKQEKQDAKEYQYLVYQLGEAFRLYKDYKSAEEWYEKVLKFESGDFPLTRLWYGVTLRADGKYREALKEFQQFKNGYSGAQKYLERAALESTNCRYALAQMTYPRLADIHQLPSPVNVTQGSDYAPVVRSDTLYFTSSRKVKGIKPKKHTPYINRIYKVALPVEDSLSRPVPLKLKLDKYEEAAAASISQNRMYFTEWQEEKDTAGRYLITMAQKGEKGKWQTPIVLGEPVNIDNYNSKEAMVTADGKYLIFSSDRPGGSGGFDLWYCALNDKGLPSGEAVNLGSTINSPGDEVNPFYDTQTKELVFSTNARIGMGGFDLFKSTGTLSGNQWSRPENLGYPVNSSKDDIYYYPSGKKEAFYTSSDRNSTCCLDLFYIKLKTLKLVGNVYDKKTKEPLNSAQVIITDASRGEALDTIVTGPDGFYSYDLTNRRPLKLNFSDFNYFAQNIPVSTRQLKRVDTLYRQDAYLIAYEVNKPVVLPNILYDFDKATLRPRSKRVLDTIVKLLKDNPKMVVRISSHTDSKGTDAYNMDLSQRRAQSCVDYLISKGIAASRMEAKGYGETKPLAPNTHPDGSDNPEGRQLNRRTDFTVLSDADSDSVYLKSTQPKESELHKQSPKLNYKGYNYYLQLPETHP